MRTFLATILGFGAVCASLFAVPAMWVERNIVNEDGYVELVAPLASDPDFQGELARTLSDQLVQHLGASGSVGDVAGAAIDRVALKVTELDGYGAAWEETQRRSHLAMFGDPADLPAELDQTSRFVVDIGPLGTLVIDEVNDMLPVTLTAPEQILVPMSGGAQPRILETLRELPPKAYAATTAVALLTLLSLLVARRRATTLAWLGLGALAVAGILALLTEGVLIGIVRDNAGASTLGGRLQELIIDTATASFDTWLVTLAIGGGVALVAGVAGGVLASRGAAA